MLLGFHRPDEPVLKPDGMKINNLALKGEVCCSLVVVRLRVHTLITP
jgi:hypothetical protein